jgi:hypothetical protein
LEQSSCVTAVQAACEWSKGDPGQGCCERQLGFVQSVNQIVASGYAAEPWGLKQCASQRGLRSPVWTKLDLLTGRMPTLF